MSKPHPVIRQFYIIKMDDPQVQICQGGVRESAEVDVFRTAKVFSSWFADDPCELCTADTADAHCLEGDCAGYLRIGAELRTVPRGRVCGYDKRVVLLIPGIETGCAPRPQLADGCDAQQVMTPEERLYSFVKFLLCHGDV